MPEPEAYVTQPDAMTPQMRRNYVRDRTQAALTYIKEYEASQEWEHNPQYDVQQVQQRLQIVYGKADQVKQRIDTALLNDDIYRRRRVMRALELPERFPLPQNMKNSPVATWVQWIRDESNKLIAAIDEEISRCQDPDDPFDGTASGIYPPLHEDEGSPQRPVPKVQPSQIKIDESISRNLQTAGALEGKLIDVQTPPPRQVNSLQQNQQQVPSPPQEQQQTQQPTIDSSQNRTGEHTEQRDVGATSNQATAPTSNQRRVEESQEEISPVHEQQIEDPFRTLRSFHEKQRIERQGGNQPRTSVSSHSTLEGAVGGIEMQYPKPQRQTKNQQTKENFWHMMSNHQRDNPTQGPHNTTTYMDLPSSMQGKICGRCGLMGHIKRFCKEEVYCKYCKIYTHSTTACRTYPATSSRKNTPEKRTLEDIDQEVNRRVQEGMLHILTDLATNQQVINNQGTSYPKEGPTQMRTPNQPVNENIPYQHIPEQRQEVQNLIGEFQRPPEVTEQEHGENNNSGQIRENRNQDPILNQQWNEPPHLQPPLRPMNIPISQTTNSVTNTRNSNITAGANIENPATHRRVEMSIDEGRGRQLNCGGPTGTDVQSNVTPSAMNR